VVPSWLALCWIALGSGFESQRGHLFFGISLRGGDITGGFCPGAGFPSCHKLIYRVSEDNFRGSACVCPNGCQYLLKDGGLVFHNLRLHKDNKLE
jgi:hypothetical protein